MHRFKRESWAHKVKESYPKRWSTTYGDFNISTDRHYVHDLGHDPHYVYDREPASYYMTSDGKRHHHYEMTTQSTENRTGQVVHHYRAPSRQGRHGSLGRLNDEFDDNGSQHHLHQHHHHHHHSGAFNDERFTDGCKCACHNNDMTSRPGTKAALRQSRDHMFDTSTSSRSTDHCHCDCHNYSATRPPTTRASSRHSSRDRGTQPVKVRLPPLHLANQSTRLAAEIQHEFRRRPTTSRLHKPSAMEKFLGFKYRGQWKPNRTAFGYSVT